MPDSAKPRVEKVSIALTQDMATMVRNAVDSREFASSSEVIRDALRDWKSKRAERELKLAELRQMVADGHASGTADWTGSADILAKARKAAGL
ncbi:MAG: type II toxin-antitoxin system ParD family antitoxin [Asticcacaulis sp.]|nr:type II toxin-antitoxin system ParD family antitoxin [Asticcacaulis sp.]